MTDVVSVVRALTDVTDNSDEGINSCDKIVKDELMLNEINWTGTIH